MKKTWVIFGILLIIGLTVVACATTKSVLPPEELARGVYPVGTATPVGYRAGFVIVRDLEGTITPMASAQVGSHYQIYWEDVQPNLTATPDWHRVGEISESGVSTRVAYIQSQGQDVWLSVVFYENSGQPSAIATDSLHVPTGVATIYYDTGSGYDRAPNYGSRELFQQPYANVIQSLINQFDSDVAGYIIEAGVNAETQNVSDDTSTTKANFEQQVSCSQYQAWVKFLLETWRLYTSKPLYLKTFTPDCAGGAGWKSTKFYMSYSYGATPIPGVSINPYATPSATPLWIGFMASGLEEDRFNAHAAGTVVAGWGMLDAGQKFSDLGGTAYEPGILPSWKPTAEAAGIADMLVYAALNAGADNLFFQKQWPPYISNHAWYAITTTVGTDATDSTAAWIVLRAAEDKTTGSETYAWSGWPGPYTHLANLTTGSTPTPACIPVLATQVAAASGREPPYVCKAVLSTPVAPESRNVLFWPASSRIRIDWDDAWTNRQGITVSTMRLKAIYLDQGTDTWTVAYKTSAGEVTQSVTNGNTQAWLEHTFSLTNVRLNGSYTGSADMEIRVGSSTGQYFYRVFLENTSTQPTVTPTVTWTPSRTPSPSPTPTGTWSTATHTPTPATEVIAVQANPTSVSIYKSAPDTNYNTAENDYTTWFQRSSQAAILLCWSITKPTNVDSVASATLTLYPTFDPFQSDDLPTYLHLTAQKVLTDWNAASVTWNSTGISDTIWSVPGILSTIDTEISTAAHTYPLSSGGSTTISFNVTEIVRDWADDAEDNYGFVVRIQDPCPSKYCGTNYGFGSDRYFDIAKRPSLSITWNFAVTPTPTNTPTNTPTLPSTPTPTGSATPTYTNTPTATATGANTATATSIPSSTPTPLAGLKINEVLPDPNADYNLDGSVNKLDRAVELYNPGSAAIDLTQYRLVFNGTTCSDALGTTYVFPRRVTVYGGRYKVVFGESLKNMAGDSFYMPGGTSTGTVRLCNADGTQLDFLQYNWPGTDLAWARYPNGSGTWVSGRTPTLGGVN